MQKPKNITTLYFSITDLFSFENTFYSASRFPSGLELYKNNCFYTALNLEDKMFGLKYRMDSCKLCLDIFSDNKLDKKVLDIISNEIKFRLSLDVDYSKFYLEYSNDEFLKDVMIRNRGKHIFSLYSLYENLIISVFLQNTTVKRTIDMCSKMLSNYGTTLIYDGIELFSIWKPQELIATENDLKSLKVGYRAKKILRITDHFCKEKISEKDLRELPNEFLEKELLKIYGVGKQTVFYTMLGQFHRTDYLKHIPLWERKILSRYVFGQGLCDEKYIIGWFHEKYGDWCGFALSMIFEDIFYQHKKRPIPWLKKILRQ